MPPPKPVPQLPRALVNFIKLVVGKTKYVPVCSAAMEERVRTRYRSEIAELSGLGFDRQSCFGEVFPLARLALILPAITVLVMYFERRPMRIHEGTKMMTCYPLLVSRDKTTYANPCEVGVKLLTAFTDGAFLVSAMGPGVEADGPILTKHCGAANIGEVWASHQVRIRAFESAGKRVHRGISFQTYADLSQRETALL
jgi:hypothetical protein